MKVNREIFDPFLNKKILISDNICDRLRGRYAVGPTMENGEPEFGWNTFPSSPIQQEAAALIESLEKQLAEANAKLAIYDKVLSE